MTLIYEVEFGSMHTIKRKLKFGEDINQIIYHWKTHFLADEPLPTCAKCVANLSETPLTKAINLGKKDLVKFLLENGADINKGTNPLKSLIRHRKFDMIAFLLLKGMHHDNCLQLLLFLCCEWKYKPIYTKIIKWLLKMVDPNDYYVPIYASWEILIQHGYDPYKTFEGNNASSSQYIEGYIIYPESLYEQLDISRGDEVEEWDKKYNWRFCKKELTEFLIGLQPLEISAAELIEILDHTFPAVPCIALHRKWNLVVTVKNFKKSA